MGTNFYWNPTDDKPHCTTCECFQALHIGKRSAGWKFSLRIHPELGINELEDWKEKFKHGNIHDEYGREITVREMVDIIEHWGDSAVRTRDYHNWAATKPGKGNYDLIDCEFS